MHLPRFATCLALTVGLSACGQVGGFVKIQTPGFVSSSGSGSGRSTSILPKKEKPKWVAGKMGPWCKGYTPSETDSNATWVNSYLESEGLTRKTLNYMAKASCDRAGDPEREKKLAEWTQLYTESYLATRDDFAAALTLYIKEGEEWEALQKEQCGAFKVNEQMPADEAAWNNIRAYALGCVDRPPDAAMWWLDYASPTMLERTIIVDQCVGRIDDLDKRVNPAFAFCLEDMKVLDRKALAKEAGKLKVNLYGRVMLVETFGWAKNRAAKVLGQYEELAAKDPEWKRLLFDAPMAGAKSWQEQFAANKAAFDAVREFQKKLRAGSKKALAGCGAGLQKPFLDYLKAGKVTTVEEARARATDAVSYPLLVALLQCDAAEGRLLQVATAYRLFAENVRQMPRGPRFAAYHAALAVLNEIRADREKFPLDRLGYLPSGPRTAYSAYEETFNKVGHERAEGEIESVKGNGDLVTVAFRAVRWKEPKYKCKRTHRISRIDENGNIYYEENCKVVGHIKKSSKETPIVVPKDFAAGLKPGQMASFTLDTKTGQRIGIPVGVYTDKDKKQFLGFYGVIW